MILIGTKCQLEQTVTQELTAAAVGYAPRTVICTPINVYRIEKTARKVHQNFNE